MSGLFLKCTASCQNFEYLETVNLLHLLRPVPFIKSRTNQSYSPQTVNYDLHEEPKLSHRILQKRATLKQALFSTLYHIYFLFRCLYLNSIMFRLSMRAWRSKLKYLCYNGLRKRDYFHGSIGRRHTGPIY